MRNYILAAVIMLSAASCDKDKEGEKHIILTGKVLKAKDSTALGNTDLIFFEEYENGNTSKFNIVPFKTGADGSFKETYDAKNNSVKVCYPDNPKENVISGRSLLGVSGNCDLGTMYALEKQ